MRMKTNYLSTSLSSSLTLISNFLELQLVMHIFSENNMFSKLCLLRFNTRWQIIVSRIADLIFCGGRVLVWEDNDLNFYFVSRFVIWNLVTYHWKNIAGCHWQKRCSCFNRSRTIRMLLLSVTPQWPAAANNEYSPASEHRYEIVVFPIILRCSLIPPPVNCVSHWKYLELISFTIKHCFY